MAAVRKFLMIFLIFIFLAVAGYSFVNFYPYIFSRKVKGVIVKVERVDMNMTMLQTSRSADINPKVFSFAVAIKDEKTGEIVTASAEDRQWAVVQSGQCAEAVYYPYPPWQLDKAGTYYGARLEKLSECAK